MLCVMPPSPSHVSCQGLQADPRSQLTDQMKRLAGLQGCPSSVWSSNFSQWLSTVNWTKVFPTGSSPGVASIAPSSSSSSSSSSKAASSSRTSPPWNVTIGLLSGKSPSFPGFDCIKWIQTAHHYSEGTPDRSASATVPGSSPGYWAVFRIAGFRAVPGFGMLASLEGPRSSSLEAMAPELEQEEARLLLNETQIRLRLLLPDSDVLIAKLGDLLSILQVELPTQRACLLQHRRILSQICQQTSSVSKTKRGGQPRPPSPSPQEVAMQDSTNPTKPS